MTITTPPSDPRRTWRDHLTVAAQVFAILGACAAVIVAFVNLSNHRPTAKAEPPGQVSPTR
jgi:hypothetical protein